MRRYDFVAWKDSGLWTVHCPSLPGVYGVGRTLDQAKSDFAEAASEMVGYLADIGEPLPKRTPVEVGEVAF